ncbi:uncharacterized protein [Scyliorhinus torazame]|uniref:uncharacterized protein n=1 Tax=Scyliorhinus torazame TaxID=75743 RepID=UPI003B5AEE94
MAQEEAFRRRKLNFNEEETEILIREVTLHQDQLFGRGDTKLPPGAKNKTWHSILAKVNAVSKCTRDIGDIKKRWYDMCHRTKDKVIKLAQEAMQSERIAQREASLDVVDRDPAGPSTSNDSSEPSTSGASRDGSTGRTSGQPAFSGQRRTPVLPQQVAWHTRQVAVQPLADLQTPAQWPPMLLFTLGPNATRDNIIQEKPRDQQSNNSLDETIVEVKQEDIGPNFDVGDYSSPDIISPQTLPGESPFRPQGKRVRKQVSEEELLGVQEQHNVLLGDGNEELHGIRQELRELRGDLQELAAGIRKPLERLADCMQALLPLLQHPPGSRMVEMTDSFTQLNEEETTGFGESPSHSRRSGRKICKRPKLEV